MCVFCVYIRGLGQGVNVCRAYILEGLDKGLKLCMCVYIKGLGQGVKAVHVCVLCIY